MQKKIIFIFMAIFSSITSFEKLLPLLLLDHSRRSNILLDDNTEITVQLILKSPETFTRPRYLYPSDNKKIRCKKNAEVFTPSWMCNIQNNLIDSQWFGRKNVFNKESQKKWISNKDKIAFPKGKSWQDYIALKRLEICCGEAPYLASRYDSVTGQPISISERIGLLDRKMRVINENANSKSEWEKSALIAYKSIYGYEKNGKNLLLARLNLFYSFIEYYSEHFNKTPRETILSKILDVISWNLWQMEGLNNDSIKSIKLMDWDKNKVVGFDSLFL